MSVNVRGYDTQFLVGGGEMGVLIREKDWSKSPVNNPENWPQSLRTTLNILLNSKFPMFLWWGPELICFYNDAYRPSLGKNGKHPAILGMGAEKAWPEIWDIIKPLIDQVLAGGEATWSEDQLIPIYRNGKIEDVYWTFSYSPVFDESATVAGVLVTCSETTKRVNTLKVLEESNRRYFNNIMQAPVAMCIFTGKNHVVEIANPLMLELWGKTAEQVLNKPIFEGLPEAKGQGLEQLIDDVFNSGEKFVAYERPVKLPRNDTIETTYINFVYDVLTDPNGSVSGIVATASEVTIQVITRKNIEEAEERLRLATEATELSTWDLDLQTREIIHSPRLAVIFGHDKSKKLTHWELRDQVHRDDIHEIVEKAFDVAIKTGVIKYEARIVKPGNSISWIRSQGKVFYDEEKKPIKLIGTLRDITEEKYSQQVLLESEQKFRLLADSMPQHIWTADPQGNLNYYNQSVYSYSGLTPDQIDKEGWLQIVHPDDREENIRTWKNSVSTGNDFMLEHRFRRHDGEYRWQLSRAIPQKDTEGNTQMWVGTSTDIQDQKTFRDELEKQVLERTSELEQKNKELETMNAELQSFAYVSSHDLQEPLRKIQTFATRILEKEKQNLSEDGKDYFHRMQDAAKRMQTLIEDLLTYSRTNTADRNFENTDLNNIIAQVKTELKEDIEQKHAIVEANHLCEAHIIPFQFRQLMLNLVGNALKFSRPGISPHITLSSKIVAGDKLNIQVPPQKKFCHIAVSDNGIGFDPRYKDRIFEVFQRLHGKDEYKGTGIGLAIVKKIVENHNGVITATAEINKGATFDIYLPVP
ncbi:MAG: PAS domain S-box protein [Ferruginibacter sp.]